MYLFLLRSSLKCIFSVKYHHTSLSLKGEIDIVFEHLTQSGNQFGGCGRWRKNIWRIYRL